MLRSLLPRVGVLVLAGCLAACGSQTRAERSDPVLRIAFGSQGSSQEAGVAVLTDMLYAESLFRKESDGRLTPHLVVGEPRWSDDGHTLTLTLKPGILLHDGSKLTAGMVAEHLKGIKESSEGSPGGLEQVTSISAPDDTTIVINVARPDFFLLAALAELRIYHPQNSEIATGPFALVQRTPTVETKRFDRYHGGAPALAGVSLRTYESQRAAWAALLRGEVDVVQEINPESADLMAGSSQVQTFSAIQPFFTSFVFNFNHPILGNPEVRRALDESIDRAEIIARVMRGRAQVATGPIWPSHWAYTENPRVSRFDPESAKARFDKAGYRERSNAPQNGPRQRFTLKCMVLGENAELERVALLLQDQLFYVGVNLELELTPLKEFGARAGAGQFETYLAMSNAGRTLEPAYRFWRSAGPENPEPTQRSGYTGADSHLDRLRQSTSEAAIKEAIAGLTDQFAKDVPAAFIAWSEVTRAFDRRFSTGGMENRDPFFELWRWRLAPDTQ